MTTTREREITRRTETSEETRVTDLLAGFKGEEADLIPMLCRVQDTFGFLPEAVLKRVAAFTGQTMSQLYGVVSFYGQFTFKPTGRHVIKVCRGSGCYVKSSHRLCRYVEGLLGIRDGQTTPDGRFTLQTVPCFGSCHLSPVLVIDGVVHTRVTLEEAHRILEATR